VNVSFFHSLKRLLSHTVLTLPTLTLFHTEKASTRKFAAALSLSLTCWKEGSQKVGECVLAAAQALDVAKKGKGLQFFFLFFFMHGK